jgi:hypothetical protein
LDAASANFLIGSSSATLTLINQTTGAAQEREFHLVIGNGGFEAGGFDAWTFSGSSVDNFAHSIDRSAFAGVLTLPEIEDTAFVRSGVYGAFLGQRSSLGSLSQTLPTEPGQKYLVSFWLANPVRGNPNQFRALWNGQALFDQSNMARFAWTNMQFTVTATGTNSAVQFEFRNERNAFALDEIRVEPLPPPVFQTVSHEDGVLTFRLRAPKGRMYQLQHTADFNEIVWSDLGDPVVATEDVLTVSDPITSFRQRFYRVVVVETP